ncbi:MAG: DUF3857 domain-containing protein [Acidobacteria bacterium]|nr:MAG: DUF3857 domain-containing protein [Acidobacteriota bacterium]REJ97997.1 MAG: DUF3857 domain-containing protein [Acidobacteriota bacterium]REK16740.1 MAG: DUF3857 domain-containing protein [Acidobacteriota bacterium]REK42651.1 MAG: DUF3857 domain-containing protein [Acidobacteriota bacterium]
MNTPFLPRPLVFLASLLVLFQVATAKDEIVWRTVTQAELEMAKPVVDPDADAEAIFWDVTLDDKKKKRMTLYHYVRVKIFTERGREKFSKFDIPYSKRIKIENVAARVVKPDGTIINVQRSDIFDREILKAGKVKIYAKSFAVPGIEPGVIVEYQYEESRKGDSASGERLLFQRDIPLQRVSYYIRPYKGMDLLAVAYNMTGDTHFVDDSQREGFRVLTRTNVPAIKEEPYMPPDDEVRRWVYLRYSVLGNYFEWSLLNRRAAAWFFKASEPNKKLTELARSVASGASTDEEKLRKLYRYAQGSIRNLTYDPSVTEEELEKIKLEDAEDVLKRSAGTAPFIDVLFAALARALNFETNLVFTGDRSEQFFNPDKYNDAAFVHQCCIAVKVGELWQYFNPGTPFLPFGTLVWYEEHSNALLTGRYGFLWRTTRLTPPEGSEAKRWARLVLSDEGRLEGTIRYEYTGHQAIVRRMNGWDQSEAKREAEFVQDLKEHLSEIEVSGFRIENFSDPSLPLTYSFRVRIPNYAQRTGKRMFLRPGFFEYGAKAVFPSENRSYDIYFPYPWSESDDIEIVYPEGFEPENIESPGEVTDRSGISSQKFNVSIDEAERKLMYKRTFHFGRKNIFFRTNAYPALKKMFDLFNTNDQHSVALRRIEVP